MSPALWWLIGLICGLLLFFVSFAIWSWRAVLDDDGDVHTERDATRPLHGTGH